MILSSKNFDSNLKFKLMKLFERQNPRRARVSFFCGQRGTAFELFYRRYEGNAGLLVEKYDTNSIQI